MGRGGGQPHHQPRADRGGGRHIHSHPAALHGTRSGREKSAAKLSPTEGTQRASIRSIRRVHRPGHECVDPHPVGAIPAQKVLRPSTAFLPPQVLDEDPQDESGAARNAQLAVQAFDMRVDRVRRNTELDRDLGFLLVVEYCLHDLGLPLGELKRSREEAPDVVGEYRVSRRPDGSCGEQYA
jgi:hypothetical protein